jgi:diguanylate cyclase (GGDEF)-like protein/PAS domain S-box-containing protein
MLVTQSYTAGDGTRNQRNQMNAASHEFEEQHEFETVWSNTVVGIGLVSNDGAWLRVNPALCELAGHPEEELLRGSLQDVLTVSGDHEPSTPISELLHRDATAFHRRRESFVRATGEHGVALLSITAISALPGIPPRYLVQIEDVTELTRLAERLASVAPPDALTGLPGRRAFVRDVALQLSRHRPGDRHTAVLLLNIDDFAEFNAAHGREAGDELLVAVGAALSNYLRPSDVIARVAGDRFGVLLPHRKDPAAAKRALELLIADLDVQIGDHMEHVTATVSVSVIDDTTLSGEVLLNELEGAGAHQLPSTGHTSHPSLATATATGLRGMHSMRGRLGVGAVAIAAAGSIVYGVTALVHHHSPLDTTGHAAMMAPASTKAAVLHLSGQYVAISAAGRFSVPLSCRGATCRGVLGLTSEQPRAAHGTPNSGTAVIADARFAIANGTSGAAEGQLNALGLRLLRADKGLVSGHLAVTLDDGAGYSRPLNIIVRSHATTTPSTQGTPAPSTTPSPSAPPTSAKPLVASTAPCANGDLTPDPTNLGVVEAATLCLINQVRGTHGLSALAPNAALQSSAEKHNNDMVSKDYFEHAGPAGDTPLSRIEAAGYITDRNENWLVGENIAWGTLDLSTPAAIVNAWVNSPDHYANIVTPTYTDSGLAVAAQAPASLASGQQGAIYTEDFGGVGQ